MKKITLNKKLLTFVLFAISLTGYSQDFMISLANQSSTSTTFQVDVMLTVPTGGRRIMAVTAGINFDNTILNGGTPCTTANCGSWSLVAGTIAPEFLANGGLNPFTLTYKAASTPGHLRIVQVSKATSLVDVPAGTYRVGTFRFTNTVAWTSNSNARLWLSPVGASVTNTTVSQAPFGSATPIVTLTATSTPAYTNLGYTSTSTYSVPLNVSSQDCATIGTATTTPVTCFGGADGTAKITMSALTPSVSAITYTIDGGASVPANLVAGAFTISGLAAGTYSVVISNAGCPDVTVPITITGPTSALTNTTTETACDSYTWPVTGLTYTTGGTYTGTSTNGSGCTVNETLELTITTSSTTGSVTTSICEGDSYTWPANGVTYTTTQTGVTVVTGCNTATLNLTVTPLTTNGSVTTAICAGGSYTWPLPEGTGLTYTTAQTNLTNTVGCNTATLNLTIDSPTTNGSVTTSICEGDSYTWPANGVTYTTAQSGVTFVTGCNTATLNLSINSIDYANLQFPSTASICQGSTMTAYGQVYELGVTEAAGQGAGISVEFGFSPVNSNSNPATWTDWSATSFNVQVGNNDEYQITTGATLAAGTYYYTFRYKLSSCTAWQYGGYPNGFWNGTTQNSGVLTVNPTTTNGSVTTAICAGDSYTWPLPEGTGLTYTTAQTNLTNTVGCNTATLNLTIDSPTTNGSVTTSICEGASYTWPANGVTYTTAQSGVTVVTGCNTATLNLTVTPATTNGSVTTSICEGASYTWPANGVTYTTAQSGVTVVTGCNTATLNLTVTPATTNGSVTTSICEGSSYTWPANGVTYTTAQSGVTVVTGCNTATLNLTVTPATTNGSVTTSICEGASYTWPANGVTYTTAQSGVTVVTGCNTATLNLTVTPATTNGSVTTSICEGDSYTWPANGVTYTTAQSGVTVVTGCNTATLNLTVTPATTNGSVTTSICEGDSYTWPANGVTYTTAQSGVTVVTGCNTATLNLTVNTAPTPTGSATQTFNVVNLNDATVANLVVSPAGVIWYDSLANAQAGTNSLLPTTVLINGSTYWAVNVVGACSSTPFAVTVTVALGVNGFDNENFRFYPNPTSNVVNIAYSSAITKVTVMNLLGQILLEKVSSDLQVSVDLSSLPSSTYLVKVDSDTKSKIIKVVKKD